MFCTKCGKELYEGDRFCAFCGAEVRSRSASKNDDIVFNPPFKLEAQKKTEEILKAAEERREEEKKAKRETVAFDWNLEGFPTTRPQKTEDVDFNWDSVLEKRSRIGSDAVYPEKKEPVELQEPTVEKIELPEGQEKPDVPDVRWQIYETGEALNEEVIVLLKKGEEESVLKKGLDPVLTAMFFWSGISEIIRFSGQKEEYLKRRMNMSREAYMDYAFSLLLESILA